MYDLFKDLQAHLSVFLVLFFNASTPRVLYI
jgi:hypothetical protein